MFFRWSLLFFLTTSALLAQIPLSEREALIDIYNSYRETRNIWNWTEDGAFRPHGTEGDWAGVYLNSDGNHVEGLELYAFDGDSLPNSLIQFTELRQFLLYGTERTIVFPETIKDLQSLEYMVISGFSDLPEYSIESLNHLKRLDLAYIPGLRQIPPELSNLTSLTALSIYHCGLVDFDAQFLMSFPKLEELNLANNAIEADFSELGQLLSQLTFLDLTSNQISGSLDVEWENSTNLEYLRLSQNHIVGSIPQQIGQATQLRELDLGSNQLSGELPESLAQLTYLDSLNVSNNNLTGNPAFLGSLGLLHTLELSSNNFYGDILSALGPLPYLGRLYLQQNQFTGSFPRDRSSFPNLQDAQLNFNQFIGPIPDYLCERSNLSQLDISYNQFNEFPECFFGERPGFYISFDHNEFDDSICARIEESPHLSRSLDYPFQRDAILPCFPNTLSVVPWIPEEIQQWNSIITSFNPGWNFRFFTLSGSDPIPTYVNSEQGATRYLPFGRFSRLEDVSGLDHGIALFCITPGLTNLDQVETHYRNSSRVTDCATSFSIQGSDLNSDVLLPHFNGHLPAALAVTSPFGSGSKSITCQVYGAEGFLLERNLEVYGFHPLGIMIDDLFPPLRIPEHYMVRLTQPDNQPMAVMAYQFVPGEGISMSPGVPVESRNTDWAIPHVSMDTELQSVLALANPSPENEMVEILASDTKGNTKKRVFNIAANTVQSIICQEVFDGMDDMSFTVSSVSSNSQLIPHVQCVDMSKGMLAQSNASLLSETTRLQHLGHLSTEANPCLSLFAPNSTDPVRVQITFGLLTTAFEISDSFGTNIWLQATTPRRFSIKDLFEQAIPIQLREDAFNRGYSISVSCQQDVPICASLFNSGEKGQMTLLHAEPFSFYDLEIYKLEWKTGDGMPIEVRASVRNSGTHPSPEGIELDFGRSIRHTLPALNALESVQVDASLHAPIGNSAWFNLDTRDFTYHNDRISDNLYHRVFFQEHDQLNSTRPRNWALPEYNYNGISFVDQNTFELNYSTTSNVEHLEAFELFVKEIDLQSAYNDPNFQLLDNWRAVPENLEVNSETRHIRLHNLEAGKLYKLMATMPGVPEEQADVTEVFVHKSRYTREDYLGFSSGSQSSSPRLVSPFFYQHIEAPLRPRPNNLNEALKWALDLGLIQSIEIELPRGWAPNIDIENRPNRRATIQISGEGKGQTLLSSISLTGFQAVEVNNLAVLGPLPEPGTVQEVTGIPNPNSGSYQYEDNGIGLKISRCGSIHLHDLDIRFKGKGIDLHDNISQTHAPIGTLIEDVTIAYGFQGISIRNQDGLLASGVGNRIHHMSTQGVLINNGSRNCLFDGLDIVGSRHRGFNVEHAERIAIENSQIRDSGYSGIHLNGDIQNILIRNNLIDGVNRDITNSYGDSDLDLNAGIFAYRPIYDGIKVVRGFAGSSSDILILDNVVRNVGDGVSLVQCNLNGILIDGNEISARRRGCRMEYGWTHTMTGAESQSFWADLDEVYLTGNNLFTLEQDSSTIHSTGYERFFPCADSKCWECAVTPLASMGHDLNQAIAFYPFPFNFFSYNNCQGDCDETCLEWLANDSSANTGTVYLPLSNEATFIAPNAKVTSIDAASPESIQALKQRVINALSTSRKIYNNQERRP